MNRDSIIEDLELGFSTERIMERHKTSKGTLAALRAHYTRLYGEDNKVRVYGMIDKDMSNEQISEETGLDVNTIRAHRAWYTMRNRPGKEEISAGIYDDLRAGVLDEELMDKYGIDEHSLRAYKASFTRRRQRRRTRRKK